MAVRKPKPRPLEITTEYTGIVRLSGNVRPTIEDMYLFLGEAEDAGADTTQAIQGTSGSYWGDDYTNIFIDVPAQGV